MASASNLTLQAAIAAVGNAFDKLESAVDAARTERDGSADAAEKMQSELTESWQAHSAKLEADLAESQAENSYLKEDNGRLSNQLQDVQQELLDLQTTASGTMKRLDKSVKQLDLILERA